MSTRTIYYGLSLSRCACAKQRRLSREKTARFVGEFTATILMGVCGAAVIVMFGFYHPGFAW